MPAGATYLAGLSEAEVRHLCGPATFRRADLLQQAGHVLAPTAEGPRMAAAVRGTWRRLERTTVTFQGARPVASCSCLVGGYCRHAGALLLHWVRAPASFRPPDPEALSIEESADLALLRQAVPPALTPPGAEQPATPEPDSTLAELTQLLDGLTLAELRDLAQRRGTGLPRALRKFELVPRLAVALGAAESVAAVLASLSPEARAALDAIYLLSAGAVPRAATIAAVDRALSGQPRTPPLAVLVQAGLVFPRPAGRGEGGYALPRRVAAELPPVTWLAPRAAPGPSPDAGEAAPGLGRDALFLVVLDAIRHGALRVAERSALAAYDEYARPVSPHWRAVDAASGQSVARHWDAASTDATPLRLLPARWLADADLQALARATGRPSEAIAFTTDVLRELGVVRVEGELGLWEPALTTLDRYPSTGRPALLVDAWLSLTSWTALRLVFAEDGPLQLRCHRSFYYFDQLLWPQALVATRTVTAILARLRPGDWYAREDLLALLRRLATSHELGLSVGAVTKAPGRGTPSWWLADDRHPDLVLAPDTPPGWTRLYDALLGALLAGPLRWLGLVELTPDQTAFRMTPAAGALGRRDLPTEAATGPALVPHPDLTIELPAVASTTAWEPRLLAVAELADIAPTGLRFRLTPERVQAAFEAGTSGPALIAWLAERSVTALPAPMRSNVEHWWSGYGTVRLYDDLTMLELADDYLLPELLATSSLRAAVVHAISPRLVVVDPARLAELVAELTRLGHPPRVVEGD